MRSKDFWLRTGSRVALFIAQFLILVMCILYIAYAYNADILPDKLARNQFSQTSCFIISKKLSTHGTFFRRYRSDFLISYNVKGVQYNRWVSGNGLDNSFTRNESEQEDILSQFEVGRTYHCWYNPNNPQLSILVPRHNWLSIFPLMLPSIIGVITLYFALKNFLGLLTNTSPRTNKHKKKRK